MRSGLTFLIAATRCEITELRQLVLTGALVDATGRMVHALQRERGLSNLWLGSGGEGFAQQRLAQLAESQAAEAALRAGFERLDTDATHLGNGARLFSRIAWALQGLGALPALRQLVATRALTPELSTEAYVRLIAALLAVAFEAADIAPDPQVSRLLAARFHFMQGKEFAGQERAVGAALVAAGRAEAAARQRLLHLIDSQDRCFQVFLDGAGEALAPAWAQLQAQPTRVDLEQLRRVLAAAGDGEALDPRRSQAWFDTCTCRIDEMRRVEDTLAQVLQAACEARIAAAQAELARYEALAADPTGAPAPDSPVSPMGFFAGSASAELPAPGFGSHLERSVLALAQAQAERLQAMHDELEAARASLQERKLIERAKGLLMAHRRIPEDEAHRLLRQMAMNQQRRMREVAEAVLAMAPVWPAGEAPLRADPGSSA